MLNPGQSSLTRTKLLLQFLFPSMVELVLYGAIAAALIVLGNQSFLKSMLSDYRYLPTEAPTTVYFPDEGASFGWGNVITLAVWGFVGCCAYMLLWAAANFFASLNNQARDAKSIFPTGYNKQSYWQSRLAFNGLFVTSLLGFIAALLIFFKLVYAYAVAVAAHGLSNLSSYIGYLYLFMAFALLVVSVHILSRLYRSLLYSARLFFSFGK
jgi:hypothetical protein